MKSPEPDNRISLNCFSFVIPARDEEGSLETTLRSLHETMKQNNIPHEIVVVDDGSTDKSWDLLQQLKIEIPTLVPVQNDGLNGFGRAVAYGLDQASGDAVAVMMADASDDPEDAVVYWKELNNGYDCVFGSRFMKGGGVYDYPTLKYVVNRIANFFLRMLFVMRLNDTTNAFKAYRMEVIDGCRPIISQHFNLTIELPLKAMVRGYSWAVVPITWRNRKAGVAKLKMKEMGSRYLFICLYIWLEKYLSRGDYKKTIHRKRIERLQANKGQ